MHTPAWRVLPLESATAHEPSTQPADDITYTCASHRPRWRLHDGAPIHGPTARRRTYVPSLCGRLAFRCSSCAQHTRPSHTSPAHDPRTTFHLPMTMHITEHARGSAQELRQPSLDQFRLVARLLPASSRQETLHTHLNFPETAARCFAPPPS
ncbi:hypothetical protein HYPSUDRAFT_203825 [Hypholoma sublateritium FD-334 SS-4]|uniref:Uncharacterized protein n=1 Tax=Hypholoma sublateritium (strain FD-334 SS-4) TaxID=945553 RepID=A0A0D2L0X7_HYPSF|nr:hypothetical protein HYPSUDRAFT_203825 [Hypholoma sublateritium FD-334 SS-4]